MIESKSIHKIDRGKQTEKEKEKCPIETDTGKMRDSWKRDRKGRYRQRAWKREREREGGKKKKQEDGERGKELASMMEVPRREHPIALVLLFCSEVEEGRTAAHTNIAVLRALLLLCMLNVCRRLEFKHKIQR